MNNEEKAFREMMAMAALNGKIASGHVHVQTKPQQGILPPQYRPMTPDELADYAFSVADAMLKRRVP